MGETRDETSSREKIRQTVRRRYGDAARGEEGGADDGVPACCVPPVGPRGSARGDEASGDGGSGAICCVPEANREDDPISTDLYDADALEGLPGELMEGSLGCANPTAVADLREGETVLDLGSGAGLDVLISARRVAPGGWAYGVDMTDEMLERARVAAREAGVDNATFLRGEIEDLPLPDESVDVVMSNCVINLSTDKPRVLAEAHRVLRPGGRLAVADMVARGALPDDVRRSLELWAGCVAGALEEDEYRELLCAAGFEDVGIEPYRVHEPADARDVLREAGVEPDSPLEAMEGELASAFVRARKPAGPGGSRRATCPTPSPTI